MGIKIISHRQIVEEVEYFIRYDDVDSPGSGWDFPCNQDGDINFNDMSEAAMENYHGCESGEYEAVYVGLQRQVHSYENPTIGKCGCGREVTLESNTNRCDCGNYYNAVGQELSNPKTWGEETGEHYTDIIREM